MKSNKLIWMLVLFVISVTIAVTFGTPDVGGQKKLTAGPKATPPIDGPDFSKYGFVDYYSSESLEASEWERRRRISQRYDKEGWVINNPQDQYEKFSRHIESIPPPVIPTRESDVIVIGKIVGLTTHLSNDKSGVYSEFEVEVSQVLKNNLLIDLKQGASITIDRAGGVVRYPGGQTVLYLDRDKGLPELGREYALFLRADKRSENYEVINIHELRETKTIPLDSGRNVDDIKQMGKAAFIKGIRDKLSQPAAEGSPRRRP